MRSLSESEILGLMTGLRERMAKNHTRMGQQIIIDLPFTITCSEAFYSEDEEQVQSWFTVNFVEKELASADNIDVSMFTVAERRRKGVDIPSRRLLKD